MFEIMKGIIEASHRKYIFIREMYRKMYNARLSMNSNALNSCMLHVKTICSAYHAQNGTTLSFHSVSGIVCSFINFCIN